MLVEKSKAAESRYYEYFHIFSAQIVQYIYIIHITKCQVNEPISKYIYYLYFSTVCTFQFHYNSAKKVTYILIRHYVHTYTRLYSTYIRITYGM